MAAAGLIVWIASGLYLFVVHTAPAGASTQPAYDVKSGATQSQTYGPIPAQNAVLPTVVGDPTPDDCVTPGYCDAIPFTVELPEGFNTHDFYLNTKVSVAWTSQTIDNPVQPAQQDDVDIYLYSTQKDEKGNWVEAGHSASSANPESVTTEQTNFILVINNFSGVNTGYTVTTLNHVEHFTKPFELLGPSFKPANDSGAPPSVDPAPEPPAVEPAPAATGDAGGFTPVAPGASPTGPPRSINLITGKGATALDDVSGRQLVTTPSLRRTATEAKKPNSLAVLLWLAVLPIGLLTGLGTWLRRRSPTAIRF